MTMTRKRVEISRKELDRLYNIKRLTTAEIGRLFGLSEETIRQRLVEAGIPRRSKSEAAKGPRLGAHRLHITSEELDRLYNLERLSTVDIGRLYRVSGDLIRRRMIEAGISRRNKSEAAIRYPRADFSGDPVEKAYLIGLRLGDLWVGRTSRGPESATVTVQCTTTRLEQINLFQEVFAQYGHVNVTHSSNRNVTVVCHLNSDSFAFLLPKEDDIHEILNARLQVRCPKPRVMIRKGYRCSGGYALNQDCWALTVKRKAALYQLCTLLAPHLEHSKRRRDMEAVQNNVLQRGIKG